MKKKILSLILSLSMIFSCVPIISVSADELYSGGTGTESAPYIIASAEDMIALSNTVNNGENYEDKYFKVADEVESIELTTDGGFNPIGCDASAFYGNFDGNNKEFILDITLTNTYNAGLFGVVEDGTIKNVVTSGTVTGVMYVGGVVADAMSATVVNCTNNADVTAKQDVAGGIAGFAKFESKIINCTNNGTVTNNKCAYSEGAGGIAGKIVHEAQIVNCTNNGNVVVLSSDNAKGYAAGIVAFIQCGYSGEINKITNCINTAIITASQTADYGGGIVGNIEESAGSEIYNCVSFGNFEGTGKFGGIIGYYVSDSDVDIENCGYDVTKKENVNDAGDSQIVGMELTQNWGKYPEDLLSQKTIDALNMYAVDNSTEEIPLLYWKADTENSILKLTSEKQSVPYKITNNASGMLEVAQGAYQNETVTITVNTADYVVIETVTVTDKSGDEIAVTDNGNGTYQFIMPESSVTVSVDYEYDFGSYSGGTGTEEDPYVIKTEDDLETLSEAITSGESYQGVYFRLEADGLKRTERIGSGQFCGTFDGNGNSIELDINKPYSSSQALFEQTSYGTIKNLTTTGSVVGEREVSGIVAGNYGTVINCTNEADITSAKETGCDVGGICGVIYGTVLNCYNSGTVTGGSKTGGIAGRIYGSGEAENCVNNGSVVKMGETADSFGGVVGEDENTLSSNINPIANCYFNSDKNEGLYNVGTTDRNIQNTGLTTEELVSESTAGSLNSYAQHQNCGMYWYINSENNSFYLSKDVPANIPFFINNYAEDCITVANSAYAGDTVTVTAIEKENITVTGISVIGDNGYTITVTETEDGKWTFVMPETNVNISAEIEYNLEKDGKTYIIRNADDLVTFSMIENRTNDGYIANARIESDSVIDISGREDFIPIGGNSNYKGTFDGNGATIKTSVTLFENVSDGTVKNLNVDLIIQDSAGRAGIAYSADDAKIINCAVSGIVDSSEFAGIVFDAGGDTIIANCAVNQIDTPDVSYYGGIAYEIDDNVQIRNCVNYDRIENENENENIGMIVADCDSYNAPENCFYTDTRYLDVYKMYGIMYPNVCVDSNARVDEDILDEYYIPSRLNEYVRENKKVGGIKLKKWLADGGFVSDEEAELYPIYYTNLTFEGFTYGAFENDEITITAPSSVSVTVTDKKGKEITVTEVVTEDSYDEKVTYKFTMPASAVTVDAAMDLGIEETTEIDGKTYVVVKNGEELMKVLNAINNGNTTLNVYVDKDITVTEELTDGYSPNGYYEYNGIFDGGGNCVTFEKVDTTDFAMIGTVGEYGAVKNLIVDGTINANRYATAVAIVNRGIIYNFMNKASITGRGEAVAPVAIFNEGNVMDVINYGSITGTYSDDDTSQTASYCVFYNVGSVALVLNLGTVTDKSLSENYSESVHGYSASYVIDASGADFTNRDYFVTVATVFNSIIERYRAMLEACSLMPNVSGIYSMALEPKYFTVVAQGGNVTDETTEYRIAFADDTNKGYFVFIGANGVECHQAGETVTVTFTADDLPEGKKLIDCIAIEKYFEYGTIELTAVNDYAVSFVMPENYCSVAGVNLPSGLEKDTDGFYLVKSDADLKAIKEAVESGNTRINFRLANDIEYTGGTIGEENGFDGIFDGNNHSITINYDCEAADCYFEGLFSWLDNDAVVKNLTIEGEIIAEYAVGAIAYTNYGSIINCVNNANISSMDSYGYVGGIVVCNKAYPYVPKIFMSMFSEKDEDEEAEPTYSGLIRGCTNNGTLSGRYVGGIAGYMYNVNYTPFVSNNGATIEDCVNNADIINVQYSAGILVNAYSDDNKDVNIVNCVNNGDIIVDLDRFYDDEILTNAGGIATWTYDTIIDGCVNNGNVVAYYAGGVVEYAEDTTVINCENNNDVKGTGGGGGIAQGVNYEGRVLNNNNNGYVIQIGKNFDSNEEYDIHFAGVVGYVYGDIVIDNCMSNTHVSADNPYAITYSYNEKYTDVNSLSVMSADNNRGRRVTESAHNDNRNVSLFGSVSDIENDNRVHTLTDDETDDTYSVRITNTYYFEVEDIPSSNISSERDKSVAVDYGEKSLREIAYNLNQSKDERYKKWSVDDKTMIIFADEDNPAVYKVTIADDIENGEIYITSEWEYVKAGETAYVHPNASDDYEFGYVTGVELDENYSFVMPEKDVEIGAYFYKQGDGYMYLSSSIDENDEYTLYYGSHLTSYNLMIAGYDENGALESIQVVECDEVNNTLKVKKGENKKFMLWEYIDGMRPLSDAVTVK